ncbi:MAG: hypothetical protein KDL87_18595, partial [Verrucomicrobiae bacterium]|nr:hypothetical protein [Verrucomicrobiae bacterium]
MDRKTESIRLMRDGASKARDFASRLVEFAKQGDPPEARPEAVSWLYFLARDLTRELRKLGEQNPEWIRGIAEHNTVAPWAVRKEDSPLEVSNWLQLIELGALGHTPEVRTKFLKGQAFERAAAATYR